VFRSNAAVWQSAHEEKRSVRASVSFENDVIRGRLSHMRNDGHVSPSLILFIVAGILPGDKS
jgi:hypothetical protein